MPVISANETITAIATGLSAAGISVIRISGPEAFVVAEKLFRVKKNGAFSKLSLEAVDSHTVHYGFVVDSEEKVLDEVMLLVLKAPRTFTREDTIEIDCHGGIVVTRRILRRVLEAGARLAEPGEFTKRAFLNGRIDLSQAEAVIDVINAKNELSLSNSIRQLKGEVLQTIVDLRDKILHEVAFIEAALDDPEHISIDGFAETLRADTRENLEKISKLLRSSENGRLLSQGIRTVIVGKPNAGKSSLMNRLLREERAIVTDIAGTTRDTLCEEVNLDGITLQIVDTAGIRETEDTVEQIGVKLAKKEAKNADLVIFVTDASCALNENDEEIVREIAGKKILVIRNKQDLTEVSTEEELREMLKKNQVMADILSCSLIAPDGVQVVEEKIKEMFFTGSLQENDEIFITAERHMELLREAKESLKEVIKSIEADMGEDFYSIDLMNAYSSLGQIIGEEMDEDLVNMIFKEFCMGK